MLSVCLVGALPNNENTKITWYPFITSRWHFLIHLTLQRKFTLGIFSTVQYGHFVLVRRKSKLCWQTKLDLNMCALFVSPFRRKGRALCIGIALSVCPLVITLPLFPILLHQTFKLYCCWQHRHNDGSCFRSRSHLSEFSPFSTWILSRKLNEGYLCQILVFLRQTFKW